MIGTPCEREINRTCIYYQISRGEFGALDSAIRVIAVPCLDGHVLLFRREMDLVVAGRYILTRSVADAVLIAQVLRDRGVNLFDGLLLRDLKQATASFSGDPLQNLLAVGAL